MRPAPRDARVLRRGGRGRGEREEERPRPDAHVLPRRRHADGHLVAARRVVDAQLRQARGKRREREDRRPAILQRHEVRHVRHARGVRARRPRAREHHRVPHVGTLLAEWGATLEFGQQKCPCAVTTWTPYTHGPASSEWGWHCVMARLPRSLVDHSNGIVFGCPTPSP